MEHMFGYLSRRDHHGGDETELQCHERTMHLRESSERLIGHATEFEKGLDHRKTCRTRWELTGFPENHQIEKIEGWQENTEPHNQIST
uniref:Uncharacterized protein n=1 Tax=Nymphaea colorata TaxID=210225 RepID=A0A5K0WT69_9MAGN